MAEAGVIRAEVIDGTKSTQFTKWGRKYLPGTAWEDGASRGFILLMLHVSRSYILNSKSRLQLADRLLNMEVHHRDVMDFFVLYF